ncbi:MAG: DUF3859 domain-containing protein [Deltaproteobacteria bacterium]|nr:DUF3859 domain-containing protein [Deltaproteobacteria bacterium]
MLKLFISIVLVLGLVLGSSSWVLSGDVYAEIVDYGIYTAEVEKTAKEEGAAVEVRHEAKDWKMVKTTTNIPMKLGTRFGVLFNLKGKPEGTKIKLRNITIYPKQGLTNPKTGKTYHKNEFYFTYTIGGINGHLHGFDEPLEMVSGHFRYGMEIIKY